MVSRPIRRVFLLASLALSALLAEARADEYYRIEKVAVPKELKLEVGGMALRDDGTLALAIRKGEVWILENPEAPNGEKPHFRRFASGLHEPLGLAAKDGDLYLTQRTEVTRLRDRDGDGIADEYWTVANGWGVSGNYHEYAYGPQFDLDGNLWVTLNARIGRGIVDDSAWRGWSLKIAPDGSWQPVSGGLRSPCGLGRNREGDVFCVDHQGNWVPTCSLIHLQPGVFHGHADALAHCTRPGATFKHPGTIPPDLTVAQASGRVPSFRLPAVWFPYKKMGQGLTDLLLDDCDGRFGPFAGQMFVGEFTLSAVYRVDLEKVGGQYQGACFPFQAGFDCAVMRLAFGRKRSLFCGETNRGWNSLGSRSFGLERVVWSGKTPFELLRMRARPNGFELEFTQPIDPKTLNEAAFRLKSYTYKYHSTYGSPEMDALDLEVTQLETLDARRVRLTVKSLRTGYVHELRLGRLRSTGGQNLRHAAAYYTLNAVPK